MDNICTKTSSFTLTFDRYIYFLGASYLQPQWSILFRKIIIPNMFTSHHSFENQSTKRNSTSAWQVYMYPKSSFFIQFDEIWPENETKLPNIVVTCLQSVNTNCFSYLKAELFVFHQAYWRFSPLSSITNKVRKNSSAFLGWWYMDQLKYIYLFHKSIWSSDCYKLNFTTQEDVYYMFINTFCFCVDLLIVLLQYFTQMTPKFCQGITCTFVHIPSAYHRGRGFYFLFYQDIHVSTCMPFKLLSTS